MALIAGGTRLRVTNIFPTVLPELLVGFALAANLLVILLARHFPYQDAPNNLARYALIERFLFGKGAQDYSFHWIPSNFIAVDLVGASFVHFFGPKAAEKVLTSITLVLPVVGMYLLLRSTAPGRRGWALIAVLIAFSWHLMAGLLNFVLGSGLVLCCLAWWWPRRDAEGWATPAAMAAMVCSLFFVHLSAALSLLVVLVATLMTKVPELIGTGLPAHRAWIQLPVTRAMLAGTVALAAVWGWMAAYGGESLDTYTPLLFRSSTSKLLGLVSTFYILSVKQAAFTAASYGALLLTFLVRCGSRLHRDPFFIAAILFTILYLVFPLAFGAIISDTDRRWLLFAYYLPFCLVAPKARSEPPAILAVAFVLAIANTAVVATGAIAIDRQLDDYDTVLRQIPRGTRLLQLILPTGNYTRMDPYGQYGFWHVTRNEGRVPGILSGTDPEDWQLHFPPRQHFIPNWRPYHPYAWDGVSPLDWKQIASDYDYVVLVTADEMLREEIGAHARQRLSVGAVTLYRVFPPLDPSPNIDH